MSAKVSKDIIILGIESSCDDTSVSISFNKKILSNIISNQKVHEKYGGVVPELASREHQKNIIPTINLALEKANISKNQIDAVAFTRGPGLMGSLLVGASFAKSLSIALNKPLIEINHMEAHVLSNCIDDNPQFPFICLTVSGGHTQIVHVRDINNISILGETLDDSAGETFDKCAKILGLNYPGGPEIEKKGLDGNKFAFKFPFPKVEDLNFSFSGLKTSVLYKVKDLSEKEDLSEDAVNDIAFEFQNAAIDCLVKKSLKACLIERSQSLVLSGGVAANKYLREELEKHKGTINLYYPDQKHCTDNGLMIAFAGFQKIKEQTKDFSIDVAPRWSLENVQ